MIVKGKGPSGPAKIRPDDPKHALGLVHYLRTIGNEAWIEDVNGNPIDETVLSPLETLRGNTTAAVARHVTSIWGSYMAG
jgi:hypothetical protein